MRRSLHRERRLSDKVGNLFNDGKAIRFDDRIVRKLKPDTPSSLIKGQNQLAQYAAKLEAQNR